MTNLVWFTFWGLADNVAALDVPFFVSVFPIEVNGFVEQRRIEPDSVFEVVVHSVILYLRHHPGGRVEQTLVALWCAKDHPHSAINLAHSNFKHLSYAAVSSSELALDSLSLFRCFERTISQR